MAKEVDGETFRGVDLRIPEATPLQLARKLMGRTGDEHGSKHEEAMQLLDKEGPDILPADTS